MREAEAIQQFRDAMRAAGLEPLEVIEPGKLHRFSTNGKTSDNAGWCKLFSDLLGGVFGDYRTGLSEKWQAKRDKPFTRAEREAFKRQCEQAKQERQAEQDRQHAETAKRAKSILDAAQDDPDEHPYICRKRIACVSLGPHVKRGPWPQRRWRDALLLPLMDSRGEVWSAEAINVDGEKDFLKGGRTKGLFYPFGDIRGASRVLIGEGFASVGPCVEVMQCAGVAAMYSKNLESVALAVREIAPDAEIILLADNDIKPDGSNPGVEAATHAAKSIGGKVAIPELDGKPCDFCDVWDAPSGKQAIREAINAARAPVETDEECFERLAKLSPAQYDRVREAEADRLNIRIITLDAEVEKRRPKSESNKDAGQGSEVSFPEPEPWPEAVDGAKLLDDIAAILTRHAKLVDHADTAIALWAVFTYTHQAADICPMLALTSPEKRCGKTTVLSLLSRLCYRPLPAANISPAAVFRTIEQHQPCLLIDEADTFLRQSDELRGIINSGHTRDTAFVIRLVGDNHESRRFGTWGPKAIACIGAARDTTMDRCIVVPMKRKLPSEPVTRLRHGDKFGGLASQCVRFAQDHINTLSTAETALPDGLNDRAADNWTPLLAIADAAGGDWPKRAREAAVALSGGDAAEDTSTRVQVLADIRDLFNDDRKAGIPESNLYIASARLAERLSELDDRPWQTWRKGKPLDTNSLAKLLKPFGISPERINNQVRGYKFSYFKDAFERYLPKEKEHETGKTETEAEAQPETDENDASSPDPPVPPVTPSQTRSRKPFSEDSSPSQKQNCDGSQNLGNPRHSYVRDGVTGRKGGNGQYRYNVNAFCQACNETCHAPLAAWINPTFEIIRHDLNGRERGYV